MIQHALLPPLPYGTVRNVQVCLQIRLIIMAIGKSGSILLSNIDTSNYCKMASMSMIFIVAKSIFDVPGLLRRKNLPHPYFFTQIYAWKFVVINPHLIPGTCNIADKIKQLHNTTVCSKSPTLPPEVEEEE